MSYEKLVRHFRRIGHFEELNAIVQWDQAVNMQPAAGPRRAEAVAALSRVLHEWISEPIVFDWIQEAQSKKEELDPWQKCNLKEIARRHRHATALPADLVEATTRASNTSEQAWRRLRAENDFASFAPYLETVVARQRECAQGLGQALELDPYDALLDTFEPGMRASIVDLAFAPLRDFIPGFIDEVIEDQARREVVIPQGPFSISAQQTFCRRMMDAAGLDLERARIDESHHPFCGGVPDDVRITNRYREDDFLSGLMGVIHESGHGKYEQGLPTQYLEQPVGKARGMVVHESQSLLLEMQVSRGPHFVEFLAGEIPRFFPDQVKEQPHAYSVSNLQRLQTRVERGLIRVDADEVTYPAHVMVRYDLERALIFGDLKVTELPEAWNEKMKQYLGISTLGNDKDGCLQDVHWPAGAFGYFPLYTLGALVAAQLFHAVQSAYPDLAADLQKGDLRRLDRWLKDKVWSRGSSLDLTEMLTRATGKGLDPQFFIAHLKARYTGS